MLAGTMAAVESQPKPPGVFSHGQVAAEAEEEPARSVAGVALDADVDVVVGRDGRRRRAVVRDAGVVLAAAARVAEKHAVSRLQRRRVEREQIAVRGNGGGLHDDVEQGFIAAQRRRGVVRVARDVAASAGGGPRQHVGRRCRRAPLGRTRSASSRAAPARCPAREIRRRRCPADRS